MKEWIPTRLSFDPHLSLSRADIFVLSRIDGALTVGDLVDITGLGMPEIEGILLNLVRQGAVAAPTSASEPPPLDELEELGPADEALAGPSSWIADQMPLRAPAPSEPELAVLVEPRRKSLKPGEHLAPSIFPAIFPALAAVETATATETPPENATDSEPAPLENEAMTEAAAPESGDLAAEEGGGDERSYRALYEAELHKLPLAQRITTARTCTDPTLMALCFDADPQVIRGVLENDRVNTGHARLIAFHHRNPVGLDHVAARVEFMRDAQVQRRLLRNTQLNEALCKRLLMPRRLIEIYKTSNDRDVPDRTRNGAKGLFKMKYSQSAPDEKFELIWNTEGRVLPLLIGQPIDQKTAAMICSRTMTSVMLIQSLARFPGTPPSVLVHMLKQPMVKRQAHLKNMLLQHPNVPSEAKRRM